jgi:hypothetical protein
MAWQKLDDELTDPTTQEPLSALLVRGLTRNANGYASGLSRGASFGFDNATLPMQWASYDQPTGFVFTVDCGTNALQVEFELVGNTKTATAGGRLVVRHLDTMTSRYLPVAADQTLTLRQLVFDFVSPVSGPQGFFVGWQSDVGDDLGWVRLRGGTENQVYIDEGSGGTHWHFPVTAGNGEEEHLLLRIDPTNAGTSGPQPSGDARLDYQVCYFRHQTGNPQGTFVIWPELDQSPAVLPNRYVAGLQILGHVYDLGCFQLWSVGASVSQVQAGNLSLPNAYDQATTLNGVASAATAYLTRAMPSLATCSSTPGRFGRILRVGETLYFTFAVQNQARWGVQVQFRAMSINPAQANYASPDFTLDVLDNTGTPLGTQTVLSKVSVPRFTPQPGYTVGPATLIAANGVLANADEWGMRDSMPLTELASLTPIAMRWVDGPPFDPVAVGGANVYTGAITCTSDIYLHAFFAQVF